MATVSCSWAKPVMRPAGSLGHSEVHEPRRKAHSNVSLPWLLLVATPASCFLHRILQPAVDVADDALYLHFVLRTLATPDANSCIFVSLPHSVQHNCRCILSCHSSQHVVAIVDVAAVAVVVFAADFC